MTAQVETGLIGLLGSGETAAAGGRLFETCVRDLPQPLRVAVLETPAGFEPNSPRVAGRVADFLAVRLSNYHPQVSVIPARRRGGHHSPDDPQICEPLRHAGLIFAGPGSPTYASRQLTGSLAWDMLRARIGLGAAAIFASAAAIAIGRFALPIYEIYKAGHDLHWQPGLDLFGALGLSLVVVPHWNNSEGGAELDTSRCFMGRDRFAALRTMLPAGTGIIGLDEHTGLVIDLAHREGRVLGQGSVTLLLAEKELRFGDGERFDLRLLGPLKANGLLATLAEKVVADAITAAEHDGELPVPGDVLELANERQAARVHRDWANADRLRNEIESLGWQVQDTPDGPKVLPGPRVR